MTRPTGPRGHAARSNPDSVFVAAALVAILVAGGAAAQDDNEYAEEFDPTVFIDPAPYVAFSGVLAFSDFNDSSSDVDTPGFALTAGLRGSDFVALEVESEWNRRFDLPAGGEVETVSLMANVKGIMPLGALELFLLYGVGFVWVDEPGCGGAPMGMPCGGESLDFALQGGVGFDFWWTERIGLTADVVYVAPFQSVAGFRHLTSSVGLKIRFP